MVQESGRNGTKQFQEELASAAVDIPAGLGKMNPDGDNNRGNVMDLLATELVVGLSGLSG